MGLTTLSCLPHRLQTAVKVVDLWAGLWVPLPSTPPPYCCSSLPLVLPSLFPFIHPVILSPFYAPTDPPDHPLTRLSILQSAFPQWPTRATAYGLLRQGFQHGRMAGTGWGAGQAQSPCRACAEGHRAGTRHRPLFP